MAIVERMQLSDGSIFDMGIHSSWQIIAEAGGEIAQD